MRHRCRCEYGESESGDVPVGMRGGGGRREKEGAGERGEGEEAVREEEVEEGGQRQVEERVAGQVDDEELGVRLQIEV